MNRSAILSAILLPLVVTACGGGGGNPTPSATPTPQPRTQAPSVSGDMIAYAVNRGWNYQGTLYGQSATVSLYADPQESSSSGAVDPLVMFVAAGSSANAFGGTKAAEAGLQSSASGYNALSYLLLNADGSTYAQGGISPIALLVPSTLTQGATFNPYPGATATVQSVGTVPGASGCPTPGTGATVQYTFMGGTYSISYVPGCGVTQYVGNHGETLTLTSVGSYPQLGTLSVRQMHTLTLLDSVRSLAHVLASRTKWHPLSR